MSLFAERYTKIKKYMLKMGLWPTEHVQIRTVVLVILQITFCLSAIVKSILRFDKRTASDAFTHCNGAILVIAYYTILINNKKCFSTLMCDLYSDMSSEINEIEAKFMRHGGLELRRILKIGICIYICAVCVQFVQPFLLFVYNILFASSGSKIVLPPPMALPIIYNDIITYVLESIATTITLSSIIGSMTVFMVLALYLCAQFKALRELLANNQHPGKWNQKCDMDSNRKLNKCIERHIKLTELSKIVANLYGPILWIDCLLSTINICFVIFSLAAHLTVEHFFTEFPFLCAGLSQLFMINWFSDRLLNASVDVSLGAYESRWPDLDINYRRKILFIIQRSQKPVTLQYFAKFSPSLEAFLNICTSAWGYFNILRTVVHST